MKAEVYLKGCPRSGEGVHLWLFKAALVCADTTQWSEEVIVDRLVGATQGCGRAVPRDEILRQVRSAIFHTREGGAGRYKTRRSKARSGRSTASVKWPDRNPRLIADITRKSPVKSVSDLVEKMEFRPEELTAEMMIDALFPGDPWLCVGFQSWSFATRRKNWLKKRGSLDRLQLIVPSAMTRRLGETSGGNLSEHAKSSVGPRQYIVVEADDGSENDQAAVLWHLAEFLPLVCVVKSQGKSLHGWFLCKGSEEGELLQFYRYARMLGADTAAWSSSQFVRMPGGIRQGKRGHPGNGKRQYVIYFNPRHTLRDEEEAP